MAETNWYGKPYYSLDAWCKNTLQHKCYKVALNAHMTCPNRDGTCGTRGCIFCSEGGSGDFAVDLEPYSPEQAHDLQSIRDNIFAQLSTGIAGIASKLKATCIDGIWQMPTDSPCIIAYFQAYTNTYAPVAYLRAVFEEALSSPYVCGISIATRPDCLGNDVLSLLSKLRIQFPHKFIWVELGLQTIHEASARYIRRGYPLSVFESAVNALHSIRIPIIVHVILGLPGESAENMLETVTYLNGLSVFGVKLQLLHVLKNTDLATDYEKGRFSVLSMNEYFDILSRCINSLSSEIVIHRITGDGPKALLIAPTWSADKKKVLNTLHSVFRQNKVYQGQNFDLERNHL